MTRTLDLGGAWEQAYFDETGKLPRTPGELAGHAYEHVPARVPGNVELDLSREGRLSADLFYGMNLLELRRQESFQWWYSREFSTPEWTGESGTDLVFDGLDCFATVWVDGIEVGRRHTTVFCGL